MKTQIIIEKNETTIEAEKEMTIPSRIIRASEPAVIETVLGHWSVLQEMSYSEEMFVQIFVELYEMDHGMNTLPEWLADLIQSKFGEDEVVAETVVTPICICGPNGFDADCQVHYNRITDRVGNALYLSMF